MVSGWLLVVLIVFACLGVYCCLEKIIHVCCFGTLYPRYPRRKVWRRNTKSFAEQMQQKQWQVSMSAPALHARHDTSTLLISCVDFRLRDETERFMRDDLQLLDEYDEVAIPGAALAMENSSYPQWRTTTRDIIALLKTAHHIKRVIFLDHRECAAYAMVFGKEQLDTPEKETAVHATMLSKAAKDVKQQFPDLEVYTLLLGLDGVIENLTDPAETTV